ncbi:trypsin-like peptidase domain-containing protein [Streptomyces sp. DT171]|uniref:trypsin-like peptidase domain-containing protein n=1 Tax=Streptomyces sp. DT171 TaxID=3416524 RepID=UPI003CF67294
MAAEDGPPEGRLAGGGEVVGISEVVGGVVGVPGLEAVTRAAAGLVETEDLLRVIEDAMRRVAVVEIDGSPVGTGVLVRPDVLLTAGHVLGPALASGTLPDTVEARFDFRTVSATGPYETGFRVRLTELLDSSPPTDAEAASSPLSFDAPPDRLDYVLLRTGGPVPSYGGGAFPPSPRGHYELEEMGYDFGGGGPLFLVQHPLAMRAKVSFPQSAKANEAGTRFRYQHANTLPGSSGSPVIDVRGRLVGIHHYAVGGVNQGVPAAAIASSVGRGPNPWVVGAPSSRCGANAAPIMVSWVEEDRRWAELVHDALTAAGHQVLMGPAADGPGDHGVREHVDAGGRVFAVVSPAYLADARKTAERDYVVHQLDHATARDRLVPLLVEGDASGSLALLSPVDLRDASDTVVRGRLTSAVPPAAAPSAGPPTPGSDTLLGFRPGDPLPRLQRLSHRARRAAGTVPGTVFADAEESQFAAGLYVTRNLEEELLRRLDADRVTPVVVTGEAGCGKTSILWSLARRRCESPSGEVFFLKATWLVPDDSGSTRAEQGTLLAAVEQAREAGHAVTVLVDTVDVLMNSDASWEALVTVVESAVAAGASVVMTSRVAEATELPSRWQRFRLSDYDTGTGQGSHSTSEFERAVLAHSKFFTNDPQTREDLITRMLAIVARDISLNPLCLRPLTLRMLFEIYTPGVVPDVVDTTGLYEAFWDHRVACDRRSWEGAGDRTAHDRDLGPSTMALALEMLRAGLPEARVDRVRLPATLTSQRLTQDVALLVKRGVGQLAGGVFQFFHQTFFEYAASRALVLDHGAAGLGALVRHLRDLDSEDYFLLAVLEQAWLCADRTQDAGDAAAATVGHLVKALADGVGEAGEVRGAGVSGGGSDGSVGPGGGSGSSGDSGSGSVGPHGSDGPGGSRGGPGGSGGSDGGRVPIRYGLRRAVLAVCAQSSLLTDDMLPELLCVLGSPTLPLPSLRQFLELLPSPGRTYGPRDIAFLKAASQRPDNAWIAVLEVLERLLPRDPAQVLATVRELGIVERAAAGGHELSTRGELAQFLVTLLLWRPAEAFPLLETVADAALALDRSQYVADILTRMASLCADHGDPEEWAVRADRILGGTTTTSSALIKSHTAVLVPYLRTLSLPDLVGRLTALASRLLSTTDPATTDRSLLGAILTAVAEVTPADADPAPVVDLLVRVTRREQMADLSRGSLVRLLDSDTPVGPAVRDLAVDWLVQGMPLTELQDPTGIRARVVRTALTQLDLPLPRVADVAGRAAAAWPPSADDPARVWRSSACLLHLLVRGAAAGIPEARAVMDRLPDGGSLSGTAVVAWVDPFRKQASTAGEAGLVADLLIRIDELRHVRTMLANDVVLDEASLTRLTASSLAALRAAVPKARPDVMSHEDRTRLRSLTALLAELERTGTPVPLAWEELSGWIDRIPDSVAVGWLIDLVGAGLERGDHPPAEALSLLRGLCGADGTTVDCSTEHGSRARRWCLWWYGTYGAAADIAETYRLAFHEPADDTGLIKIANYCFADRHETPLTEEEAVGLLLGIGRRLRSSRLGSAPRKNIAQAWRGAMRSVVPGGSAATHLRIIRQLPELDDAFAARVVQYVPVRRTPELRTALEDVAELPGLGARLQGAADKILDEHKRHASEGGWPGLFADLARWEGPKGRGAVSGAD